MIFSIEIMSILKEIKYHLKQSYHKQKSYSLPNPTPNLSYPLPYPTLPLTYPTPYPTLYPTLPYPTHYPILHTTLPYSTLRYPTLSYPLPYPTLPHTLPYPTIPYPLPYPTLNWPINLPSRYLSHVLYSLMSVSLFSCVILGLFWSVSLWSYLFWSILVNYDTAWTWNLGLGFG